jgi:hypothetical protein
MDTPHRLDDSAADLLEAARTFHAAAGRPGAHTAAPGSLASLEEALRTLSGACYQLAADASLWPRVDGLSRELEVRLMAALHDVGAAFARCARECRKGRSTVAPIIARRAPAESPTRGAPREEAMHR